MSLEKYSKDTLITIIEQMPSSVILTNAKAEIIYVNPFFTKISGWTLEEVEGKNPSLMNSGKTPKAIYRNLWKTITKGDIWTGELLNKSKSGEEFWERVRITPIVREEGIRYFLSIKEDITSHVEELDRTKYIARHDSLTGLTNRMFFEALVQKQIASNKRSGNKFTLMMIDLNNFKAVNDTYGHDKGDEVLIEVAKKITSVLREADLACRLGGDEFLVMLDNVDINSLSDIDLDDRIDEKISEINTGDIKVSGSFGLASFPKDGKTYADLLKVADTNMYKAKHQIKSQKIIDNNQKTMYK